MIKFQQKISLIFLVLIILIGLAYVVSNRLVEKNLENEGVIEKLEKKTFEHPRFSFSYADSYAFERGLNLSGAYVKPTIARVRIPREKFNTLEKTNFAGAYLIFSNSETLERNECLTFSDIGREKDVRKDLLLSGRTFKSVGLIEAAAGNIYESRIYRTIIGGECFEVVATVHTGNIHNYPDGEVAEFSEDLAFNLMERIILSLRFN